MFPGDQKKKMIIKIKKNKKIKKTKTTTTTTKKKAKTKTQTSNLRHSKVVEIGKHLVKLKKHSVFNCKIVSVNLNLNIFSRQ